LARTFLKATLLTEFLETLRRFGELHAPIFTEQGVPAFSSLHDTADLHLDSQRTLIPPKKYLIPFREELLTYRDGVYTQSAAPPPELVLFGLHPCDLEGIAYLDLVFLGDRPDPSYAARRAGLTLVGVSCQPDEYCFCSGSFESAPCDLFLTAHEEGFHLQAASERGRAILQAAGPLLMESEPAPPQSPPPCPIAPQDPQLRFSDNPLWERFAGRCVSCGACSVCCPTCYCFDVREYPSLTPGGSRIREWDNCLFASHGEVAGGNFRATRLERLRYRFLHKYCGFSPLQGMVSCVGCGRCREVCPVEIDLREILEPARLDSPSLP